VRPDARRTAAKSLERRLELGQPESVVVGDIRGLGRLEPAVDYVPVVAFEDGFDELGASAATLRFRTHGQYDEVPDDSRRGVIVDTSFREVDRPRTGRSRGICAI
jgi:hypothetical protein